MHSNIREYARILRMFSEVAGLEKPYALQFCICDIQKFVVFITLPQLSAYNTQFSSYKQSIKTTVLHFSKIPNTNSFLTCVKLTHCWASMIDIQY